MPSPRAERWEQKEGKMLIDIYSYPVKDVLGLLLLDMTTGESIKIDGTIDQVQPRVLKRLEEQKERTKKKAEVFTPSWMCNKMNNYCDSEWFGRESVFNREVGSIWETNREKILFGNRSWQEYIDETRLEITCGEAPYIASQYDTTTGEIIPVKDRIGMLDRKLRVVNENADNMSDWIEWTVRAVRSVYGFEYQGDNLLIARINVLNTLVDYMKDRWNETPTDRLLMKYAQTIAWNFWQMDGLKGTVPNTDIECRIMDWKKGESLTFNSVKREDEQI